MDILSHGLWAVVVSKAINLRTTRKIRLGWAFFWGLFPDLFAFGIPFASTFWLRLTGHTDSAALFRGPHPEGVSSTAQPMADLAYSLYNVSHSLIIFLAVFGLVSFLCRRPIWELLGWLLHILADIPTHSYAFFPTPVFWPFWGWKFDGFSWGQPWFIAMNYSLLAIAFVALALVERRRKREHGG